MNICAIATTVASGVAAAVIGLAVPAAAAPSNPGNAQDTVSELEDQGYTVVVNNVTDVPLDQAAVVGVREGPAFIESYRDAQDNVRERVTSQIVYVDVR